MQIETTLSPFKPDADIQASVKRPSGINDHRRSNTEADLIRRRIAARRSEPVDYEIDYRHALGRSAEVYAQQNSPIATPADQFRDRQTKPSASGTASETAARIAKRSFDIIFAALLLIGLSLLMLALVWLVRRDGKPAFYRHKRIGAGGRPFYCIKFRSMVADSDRVLADLLKRDPDAAAEWHATQKLRNDPRVTPVGRFLRKTSLDELPQLLNVLSGEMSLVGPRPIVTSETRFYGDHINEYYKTRPGITGLWQVSGRSDTTYDRRVQLDVQYVRNWSFWRDIAILLKTVPIVLFRSGAV